MYHRIVGFLLAGAGLVACGGGGGSSDDGSTTTPATATTPAYRVLAFNDLGMHCMDREYSVFSILPPFNVVNAQVVRQGEGGTPRLLGDDTIELRYSPVADASGSINTTSLGKTDFWSYADQLFGADLQPGQGLLGAYMPADHPRNPGAQPFGYDSDRGWFSAAGVPITPFDDTHKVNPYPLLRISALDKASGQELAHTDVVVPVSQETDCRNCHASGQMAAADPAVAWAADADLEVQSKKNILTLHDRKHQTGLTAATPVLCASCHYSPALDLAGNGPQGEQVGKSTLSRVMHAFHGRQLTAQNSPVFPEHGSAQQTCYQCHPGKDTQCQRGPMRSGGMECHDCHGGMAAVGGDLPLQSGGSIDGSNDGRPRRPWQDLPRCQSCHTGDAVTHLAGSPYLAAADGLRLRQAYRSGDDSASPIRAATSRFAENSGTLYRYSKGHGAVACEGCHGSTHAEWPNADPGANDNVAAAQLQGHGGTLIECTTCHSAGSLPLTLNGPHGMHNVADARWSSGGHGHFYERDSAACKACHGANLEGTVLSRTAADRVFSTDDHGHIAVSKGTAIGCNLCHGTPGRGGDD